jgi:hypothetical protein
MAILKELFIERTRLHLVLFTIGLALAEGFVKVLFKSFPLTEVFSVQTLVVGGYLSVKTINNVQEVKYANNGNVGKVQVAAGGSGADSIVDTTRTKGL